MPHNADTAPLLDTAPIDFWDFHAYADMDIDIFKQAENFGMVGYEDKPVLLGETGMVAQKINFGGIQDLDRLFHCKTFPGCPHLGMSQ